MADQRWGERTDHRRRRPRRLAGLALLCAVLIGGCDGGAPVNPGTVPSVGTNPATSGGDGASGPAAAFLIGTWENVWIENLPTDLQRITTRWRFLSGGACSREVATFSVVADQTLLTRRGCTFRTDGRLVYVRYDDASADVRFDTSNVNFDPRRLLLDGIEFVRID